MKSGYKIRWTDHALSELAETFEYAAQFWTEKASQKLAKEIECILTLVSKSPELFQKSDIKNVRRAVVLKHNSLYYRIKEDTVEIVSFFANRQNPEKRKI